MNRRSGAACIAIALLIGAAGTTVARSSATAWHLVEQRPVRIPDTRLIAMSPDGSLIAGIRPLTDLGHGQLCVYRVASLAQQACADLSGLDAGVRLEDVAWSPDGSRIAFGEEAFRYGRDGDLWLMDTRTGELMNLDDDGFAGRLPPLSITPAPPSITIDLTPAFTRDGTTIAFSQSRLRHGEPAGSDIMSVPVSGGTATRLATVDESQIDVVDHGMEWSSADDRLYYSVTFERLIDSRNGVWTIAADGSGARQVMSVTNLLLGRPEVLQVSGADDRLLAYHRDATKIYDGPQDLYAVVDAGTGTSRSLVAPNEPDSGAVTLAALSPDGSGILEVIFDSRPPGLVLLEDVASGAQSAILPDGLASAGFVGLGVIPTWATNGTVFIPGGSGDEGTLLTVAGGTIAGG